MYECSRTFSLDNFFSVLPGLDTIAVCFIHVFKGVHIELYGLLAELLNYMDYLQHY